MKVFFVGAGPGDSGLITVKGRSLLERADVVIYAGSLINKELLEFCGDECELHDSASMSLEQVQKVYECHANRESIVVRLHSGEPSLFGAIQEQIDWLVTKDFDKAIEIEVVPGVSSFGAAAAALQTELTLPGVSQTVIITRRAGRTPVPEKQDLGSLAQHNATMCIFLSVSMIEEVVEDLLGGYTEQTPVAVVERASWPEERIISGTLGTIADLVREAGIDKTAMILVGDVLTAGYERSKLYDPAFSHMFRK